VLRKVLGRHREEITGDWRKLHNDELHVGENKSKRIWWTGNIA